mgnify:CR=1 FL=1
MRDATDEDAIGEGDRPEPERNRRGAVGPCQPRREDGGGSDERAEDEAAGHEEEQGDVEQSLVPDLDLTFLESFLEFLHLRIECGRSSVVLVVDHGILLSGCARHRVPRRWPG